MVSLKCHTSAYEPVKESQSGIIGLQWDTGFLVEISRGPFGLSWTENHRIRLRRGIRLALEMSQLPRITIHKQHHLRKSKNTGMSGFDYFSLLLLGGRDEGLAGVQRDHPLRDSSYSLPWL